MQNAQTLPTAVLTKHAPVWYVEATDLDTSLSRGIRRLVKGGMLRLRLATEMKQLLPSVNSMRL